jgi:hypothetical protein
MVRPRKACAHLPAKTALHGCWNATLSGALYPAGQEGLPVERRPERTGAPVGGRCRESDFSLTEATMFSICSYADSLLWRGPSRAIRETSGLFERAKPARPQPMREGESEDEFFTPNACNALKRLDSKK